MKNKHILLYFLLLALCNKAGVAQTKAQILEVIKKVNNYWQASQPEHGNSFWHRAAYHTGNMAAYRATGCNDYLNYSLAWAEKNEWKGATSNDTSKWKYSYGEQPEFVLFGDWQICFQVYAELYKIKPDAKRIARAREVMEFQMRTPQNDYWWWVDGLYMVMPVMTKLYKITANEMYLKKLYEYFSYSRDLMYDKDTHLFYRDARYIFPAHKTNKGLKDFWARGNGWIFAAFPRILEDLPKTAPGYDEYIRIYKEMAETLATSQQTEGYWSRSILDPEQAIGPETSGTSFFTFGYLWGINNGILSKKKYKKTIEKSWKFLTETALQADGRLGYVQPIGDKAVPGQVVDKNSTADFGVGAFLLAASEMAKYVKK